ncbi:MAG: metal-sulfur cluster assembly factor [Dehalococcoidia bacterium]
MATVTEQDVMGALGEIYDPEIPMISIVDLGLVYDVKVDDGDVKVTMTLTAMGCPMAGTISGTCEDRIRQIPGVKDAFAEIVWDPPWNPEMITPEGKRALGWE